MDVAARQELRKNQKPRQSEEENQGRIWIATQSYLDASIDDYFGGDVRLSQAMNFKQEGVAPYHGSGKPSVRNLVVPSLPSRQLCKCFYTLCYEMKGLYNHDPKISNNSRKNSHPYSPPISSTWLYIDISLMHSNLLKSPSCISNIFITYHSYNHIHHRLTRTSHPKPKSNSPIVTELPICNAHTHQHITKSRRRVS
jgi:hypothetical protein